MALPLLEFRHLTVVREKRPVLIDFSMSLARGESLAILGPNGSGKSTLIKVITRELYPVQSSESAFKIFGESFWDVSELRTKLGIVSNDVRPYQQRDVKATEAVLSGFFSSVGLWPHHSPTAKMRQKTAEILKRLKMQSLFDRSMAQMSSGEAQRCLIGRALVHDPAALILDEPTNSLDVRSAQDLRHTLRRIAQSGTSLVLVTHHVEDILPEMKRVVLLRQGRLFRDGAAKALLTSKTLSALFDHPVSLTCKNNRYRLSDESL